MQQAAAPIDGDAARIKLGGGAAGVSGSKLGGEGDDGATLPAQQGEREGWQDRESGAEARRIRERQAGKEGAASGGGRGDGLRQVEKLAGGQVEEGAGRLWWSPGRLAEPARGGRRDRNAGRAAARARSASRRRPSAAPDPDPPA